MTTSFVSELVPADRISLIQFAREVGVHIATVHRWRLNGKLRTFSIGSRHFVAKEDVAAFLAGGAPPPRETPAAVKRQRTKADSEAWQEAEALGIKPRSARNPRR